MGGQTKATRGVRQSRLEIDCSGQSRCLSTSHQEGNCKSGLVAGSGAPHAGRGTRGLVLRSLYACRRIQTMKRSAIFTPPPCPARRSGFTLLEIMVVIAALGLIMLLGTVTLLGTMRI